MMKFIRRNWLLLLLSGGGLALLVYAFLPAPLPVDIATVTRGPMRVTVDEDGKTRIKEKYVISAPVGGMLLRTPLKPGHAVEADKTLVAAIEPSDPSLLDARARAEAEARVRAAAAALEVARARIDHAREAQRHAEHDFERAHLLLTTKGGSREEFDRADQKVKISKIAEKTAEQQYQVARSELDLAKAALVRTRPRTPGDPDLGPLEVLSPVRGKVLRVFQESAAVVTPGAKLLEVGDPTDLEIEIDVLSQDGVKVRPGAKVLLEHWGGPAPLEARVRWVEPGGFLKISALGVEEQRVNVIADFVDPPQKWAALGDQFRVEARIVIWEGDNVLRVPAGALFRHGDGWAVYVVAEGQAARRAVRVGHNNGLEAEVLEGLTEGDRVVVHPSDRVKDGVQVTPR